MLKSTHFMIGYQLRVMGNNCGILYISYVLHIVCLDAIFEYCAKEMFDKTEALPLLSTNNKYIRIRSIVMETLLMNISKPGPFY